MNNNIIQAEIDDRVLAIERERERYKVNKKQNTRDERFSIDVLLVHLI